MEIEFNWPIIGQKNISAYLQTSLRNTSFAQSYLFFGPKEIGKTTIARYFVNTLICQEYSKFFEFKIGEKQVNSKEKINLPCGACERCQQFKKNVYADLYWLERLYDEKKDKKKQVISVAQVRSLQQRINKRSFLNSYKIVIVPEAERLTEESSNALLKTIEEPSSQTVIILISTSQDSILPTIRSRCQNFKFLPVTQKDIYYSLVEKGIKRDLAKEFAGLSQGRPTLAERLVKKTEKYQEIKDYNQTILKLLNSSIWQKFTLIDGFLKKKELDELKNFLNYLALFLRDLILLKTANKNLITNVSLLDDLENLQAKLDFQELEDFLIRTEKSKKYLKQNLNPKLVFETLFITATKNENNLNYEKNY